MQNQFIICLSTVKIMTLGKVLIIDGNNLLHRVFWTASTMSKATPTTHIYLFLNALKSYVELFNPRKIIVCWDFREKTVENYRKMLDESYKAQRDEEKQSKVYEYMPIIIKLLDTLGISQINPKAFEADDIMFWLATVKFANQSIVITTDTDMYQLISPDLPDNVIYNPKKKREITQLYLKEYYNVSTGFEFIIQKALRGDKADNLNGVRGIRSNKIQDILSLLNVDYEFDSLKDSGLLKEDELETFKHNLSLMKFDINLLSGDEIEWYETCLTKECSVSKEDFTLLIKDLEFWHIYKKIDYWFKTLNRIDLTDVFSSIFDFKL